MMESRNHGITEGQGISSIAPLFQSGAIKMLISNIHSRVIRKPDFCLCENKGADQLCSNCTADQRLCFPYTDSTMPCLLISEISSF